MHDSLDVHGSANPNTLPLLDFERLDVYRVAIEFQALASSIALPPRRRELRDQLERAALSIVLNTAEGAGRVGAADKARFFAMARGTAMECAAILDVLRASRLAPPRRLLSRPEPSRAHRSDAHPSVSALEAPLTSGPIETETAPSIDGCRSSAASSES